MRSPVSKGLYNEPTSEERVTEGRKEGHLLPNLIVSKDQVLWFLRVVQQFRDCVVLHGIRNILLEKHLHCNLLLNSMLKGYTNNYW